MDLLVNRLCCAASYAPVAVTLHSEQILSQLSALDPTKFLRLITRFITDNDIIQDGNAVDKNISGVQLLTLHLLTSAINHTSSSELLIELPILVPLVLPAFKSELVDVRKALVFVLVAIYVVVGDALHTHVQSLSSPQKKLLTIYIEKKMAQREVACAN